MWRCAPLMLVACVLPDADFDGDGFDVPDGDCDDLDPTIHPGADDAIGDLIDQDCDGANPMMQVDGRSHGCLLDLSGDVVCEGANDHHQLDAPDPGVYHFVQVAAGWWHTCALDDSGMVVCWGDNRYGQADAPKRHVFDRIDADANYSIASNEQGFGLCWGRCFDLN